MRLSTNPKNIHLNHKSISSVFQVKPQAAGQTVAEVQLETFVKLIN